MSDSGADDEEAQDEEKPVKVFPGPGG